MASVTVDSTLVEALRNDIIRGRYVPGERLRLEELAARFEVSTMPIRQALRTLEAEGIVTMEPHKGAQVTKFTSEQILELFEIRAVLEQLATVRAVPHLTTSDLDELAELTAEIDVLFQAPTFDVARFTVLNGRFHALIYERAGRPLLSAQIRARRFQVQHYLHRHMDNIHAKQSANIEHDLLLSLARAGRAEMTGQAMYQHIMGTGEGIARSMQLEEALDL